MTGVSVIICTFNGKTRLKPTLEYLISQHVDPAIDWELIVIDNNSTDGTSEWCKKLLKETAGKLSWKIINEGTPGLSFARRRGISEAAYNICIFCDDDNWLNPNYVQGAYQVMFENQNFGIVGGKGVAQFESEPPKWFKQYSRSYAVGSKVDKSGLRDRGVYGAGMVLRKQLVVDLFKEGFDSLLSDRKGNDLVSGGDDELCLWYLKAGYQIYYDCSLEFQHFIPKERLNFKYLERRASGKGKTEALLKIYDDIFNRRLKKVNWVENRILYFWYTSKRASLLLWLYLLPQTYKRRLAKSLLKSSISFRISGYGLLQEASQRCQKLNTWLGNYNVTKQMLSDVKKINNN